jgi:hypothetical protein
MSWQTPFLLFGAFIAVITYIARRLGVPAWLAVSIPNLPIGVWFGYCVFGNVWAAGEGGALPLWMLSGSLLAIGLIASLIIIFGIPKKNDKPSA